MKINPGTLQKTKPGLQGDLFFLDATLLSVHSLAIGL
jgi:hypothetical protein